MSQRFSPRFRSAARLLLIVMGWIAPAQVLPATDYFLTLGGGYNRMGNQASLEANVVFFQQVLTDRHRGPRRHDIYFADGFDQAEDLQITADKPARSNLPATDLLASLHRRRGQLRVAYRNHRVPDIAGPLDPELIRTGLEAVAKAAQPGDRLIVYVTAHGSAGPQDESFNTTIDCWNERKITARQFSNWLDKLPETMPVVMVMAQCYCGGFARTLFQELNESEGLAPQLRAGFFAQQHDLPAAGCRPDIEHDEEFSSYFWGALAGRSRNGVPIEGADIDGNGDISFAEAYAHAVAAGETIDIPLRTSEVLLRTYSRLSAEMPKAAPNESDSKPESDDSEKENKEQPILLTLSGTLQSLVDCGRPVSQRIVTRLAKTLELSLEDDVAALMSAYDRQRGVNRFADRGRGRRPGSGRREFLKNVAEKWPELGDERRWEDSPLLKPENQETLLAELKELPGWKAYEERLKQMETAGDESDRRELRTVKFRRLINQLEAIVLEQNLPRVATPEIVERYRQLVTLEESSLVPKKNSE